MEGDFRGRVPVVPVAGLAILVVAALAFGPGLVSDAEQPSVTTLNCSSGVEPCRSTQISSTLKECDVWFADMPIEDLSCNTTTEGVEDVALVADPGNYVMARFTDLPVSADIRTPGLDTPWDLEFLPDGRMIISEKIGRVSMYDGENLTRLATIDEVLDKEIVGLMGLAVHPDFPDSPYIYLYYTHSYRNGSGLPQDGYYVTSRISRFTLQDGRLMNETVILDGIPGNVYHGGGRIEFGPDGKLYATTGDAGFPIQAQVVDRLEGKYLRMNPDGSVPADNPFPGRLTYTSGHRNPQGMAWNPENGVMWGSEHGDWRHDEINRLLPGHNYGWGAVTCRDTLNPSLRRLGDLTYPGWCALNWTLAPSGMTFVDDPDHPWNGDLFVAGLRSKHLHRFVIDDGNVTDSEIFWMNRENTQMAKRLRDVEYHDGALWVIGDWAGIARLTPG